MSMKNLKTYGVIAATAVVLSLGSCSKKGNSSTSKATGWQLNDKKGGFTYNNNFKEQQTPPGMVPVEGGTFTMGRVQDDVMHDWNNSPNQQHVQSFYMDENEVTNLMYSEYLYWLKNTYPPEEENYKNIYNGAIPDTLVWRDRLGYNETMTNNYLRHPAYSEYPVVGVNWVQAVEFSKWRTERVNEFTLEREGFLKKDSKLEATAEKNFSTEAYIASPSTAMGGDTEIVLQQDMRGGKLKDGETAKNVYAQRQSGLFTPEYRLPTEAEWEYAATALVGNREYNMYKGQKKYPWQGAYTRNKSRKLRGDQLANFKQGKGDYGGIPGWSDDGADITNKVGSYAPNDFGLYDMAGNVAEWVADVYRPTVDDEANDFNYFRGNVYMKNQIGEDGKIVIITAENIVYDTLSNGKIVARNLPGQLGQVPVDENETYLRQNFSKSDNRNYRDGDKASTRFFNMGEEGDEQSIDKYKMYESPVHSIESDSIGAMLKEYDRSDKRTTLIDDNVRVYKGGSWRDRAYWLDPAQRRFFPQDMATDYIGFRNAMSKVGPKSDKKSVRGNPNKVR